MSSWAKPGVKVVCVREPSSAARAAYPQATWPVMNGIYTIRDTPIITHGRRKGEITLLLHEIVNPIIHQLGTVEPGMPLFAFRPLVAPTQEQDLELFRHLLEGQPVSIHA